MIPSGSFSDPAFSPNGTHVYVAIFVLSSRRVDTLACPSASVLQVVTIATYTFFVACLVGRQQEVTQLTDKQSDELDLYIPLFTILQFLFYMGLLKVSPNVMDLLLFCL